MLAPLAGGCAMTVVMRNPLLRVLQGEEDVLYATEDGTILAKFDRIEIEVAKNGATSFRFMKDNTLVSDTSFHSPLSPGETLVLSVQGGIKALITV